MDLEGHVLDSLTEAKTSLERILADSGVRRTIADAGARMAQTLTAQGRVFSCGNGGSLCDAMHFAEELTGRYRKDRPALAGVAISDPSHLTCVGNDFGYDTVFSRYLEAHARPGDCLLAISTSGKSPNVLAAARTARERDTTVVALTGRTGTPLGELGHVEICTPAGAFADRVQEIHIKVIHILVELVERQLFPHLYN